MKLIGYQRVSYSRKDGSGNVSGYSLYFLKDDVKEGNDNGCGCGYNIVTVKGRIPFISDRVAIDMNLSKASLNKDYVLQFNMYGGISAVVPDHTK